MNPKNPKVNAYFNQSGKWQGVMLELRRILLDCQLTEELKWGKPCYTVQDSNVAILSLMQDAHGILKQQGAHSQAVRLIRLSDVPEALDMELVIRSYIEDAIDVEKAGLKVDFKEKHELVFPEELHQRLDEDQTFNAAFSALTPGRQRGYNLHFSEPKQSRTRASRIDKCRQKILAGKGMHDR